MSIQSEITRISNAKADIVSALDEKGVAVASNASISDMGDYIRGIETGGGSSGVYVGTGDMPEDCNVQINPEGNIDYFINALKAEIFNAMYPVGSLYISTNSTDPGTLFGGTWNRIKDTFILAAGDTYSAGTTGGEATVALSASHIPSHNHTFTGTAESHTHTFTGTAASHTHTFSGTAASHTHTFTGTAASHTHNMPSWLNSSNASNGSTAGVEGWSAMTNQKNIPTFSASITPKGTNSSTSITPKGTNSSTSITPAGSNSNTSITPKGTISNTGGDEAHNNMPPYITKYVWERVA